jgi:diadenylate cyclase
MNAVVTTLRDLLSLELGPRDLLDIALVTLVFYLLLTAVRGTRAFSVLWGILIITGVYYAAHALDLITL